MSAPTPPRPPARPWRIIAAEISQEHDSKKMAELVQELDRAMQEQGLVKPNNGNERKSA